MPVDTHVISEVIEGRRRLSAAEAMELYGHASQHDLGQWASAVSARLHGTQARTYVLDRNVNYTNVCSARCTFCAFRRDGDEPDAYTLSKEQLREKLAQLQAIGGTQVLLQGGMNPRLPLAFYEDMLTWMKREFPAIHRHAFSPPELVELVAVGEVEGFPTTKPGHSGELEPAVWTAKLETILRRLQAAGLDSIPGGGGEIFAEHVRRRIGLGKATADQWLNVMRCAHRLGMFTSATMMFGHIESVADRIDHMQRIRDAQDEAIRGNWPGRYVSFIAWPFQRENTPMGRLPDWDVESDTPFPGENPDDPRHGKSLRMAGATEYLRIQAISRLFLDNILSIGSSWVTMGPHIGQLALFHGANDMGSVMMEENVVSAAGTTYSLDEALLCRLIRDAGFVPAQRDNVYRVLRRHDGPDSPDLRVTDWSTHRVSKPHPPRGPSPSTDTSKLVPLIARPSTSSS
ncbi:MAG: radical SAM protein [Phycisphaeraceae bacterium]|nr:radical SAM protein [Phycisphaeraceae bacterium]